MPSDRRCVLVRFSDDLLSELDQLTADFGVSRSAIVAALVEVNSDQLEALALSLGLKKGQRRVSPKLAKSAGFSSCMASTTATNSHN